jgi:hypothetical protein
MKSYLQIAFLVGVLMAIVGGLTFVTQYTSRKKDSSAGVGGDTALPPDVAGAPALKFRNLTADWDPSIQIALNKEQEQAKYLKRVEVGDKRHYDFWFQNPDAQPIAIGLQYKQCTCSDVQVYLLPEPAWSGWQRQMGLAALLQSAGPGDLLRAIACTLLLEPLSRESSWVNFGDPSGKGNRAEPAATAAPGQFGILRVNFQPRKLSTEPGGERLVVTIQNQHSEHSYAITDLAVRYEVVPAMGYHPVQLDIGEIGAGGGREETCYLWSTTRESLEPTLEVSGPDPADANDPCIEIGKLVSLTAAELESLPGLLGDQYKGLRPTCAYRVAIKVHENRSGKRLDLGPLTRRITIKESVQGESWRLPIAGLVRGEVQVGGGDDRGRIALGSFKLERGTSKSVLLTSTAANVELERERATDPTLEATLESLSGDGPKQWRLTVTVAPNKLAGDLPSNAAIVLKIKDSTRRIRIPVTGNAHR